MAGRSTHNPTTPQPLISILKRPSEGPGTGEHFQNGNSSSTTRRVTEWLQKGVSFSQTNQIREFRNSIISSNENEGSFLEGAELSRTASNFDLRSVSMFEYEGRDAPTVGNAIEGARKEQDDDMFLRTTVTPTPQEDVIPANVSEQGNNNTFEVSRILQDDMSPQLPSCQDEIRPAQVNKLPILDNTSSELWQSMCDLEISMAQMNIAEDDNPEMDKTKLTESFTDQMPITLRPSTSKMAVVDEPFAHLGRIAGFQDKPDPFGRKGTKVTAIRSLPSAATFGKLSFGKFGVFKTPERKNRKAFPSFPVENQGVAQLKIAGRVAAVDEQTSPILFPPKHDMSTMTSPMVVPETPPLDQNVLRECMMDMGTSPIQFSSEMPPVAAFNEDNVVMDAPPSKLSREITSPPSVAPIQDMLDMGPAFLSVYELSDEDIQSQAQSSFQADIGSTSALKFHEVVQSEERAPQKDYNDNFLHLNTLSMEDSTYPHPLSIIEEVTEDTSSLNLHTTTTSSDEYEIVGGDMSRVVSPAEPFERQETVVPNEEASDEFAIIKNDFQRKMSEFIESGDCIGKFKYLESAFNNLSRLPDEDWQYLTQMYGKCMLEDYIEAVDSRRRMCTNPGLVYRMFAERVKLL